MYSVLEVSHVKLCSLPQLTVLNYPSLYTVFPSVLIGREIASVNGEKSVSIAPSQAHYVLSCPQYMKSLSFSSPWISVKRITIFFRLSKPNPSSLSIEATFPRSLKTFVALFCTLFQLVHVFPKVMYTCRWTQDSSQELTSALEEGNAVCNCCVSNHMTLFLQCDALSALDVVFFFFFLLFKNWELPLHLVNHYLVFVKAITKPLPWFLERFSLQVWNSQCWKLSGFACSDTSQ